MQLLTESIGDAVTGCQKNILVCYFEFPISWDGREAQKYAMWILKRNKKKPQLTHILYIFVMTHKALRCYLFFLEDLKPVTNPCSPSVTPPFLINY